MVFKVNITPFPKYSFDTGSEFACVDIPKISGERAVAQHKIQPGSQFSTFTVGPSLRFTLLNAPEAYVVVASAGHILSFNRHAQTLFGYDEEEVRGAEFGYLLEPGYQPDVVAFGASKSDHSIWTQVCRQGGGRARRKNGELFAVEMLRSQCANLGEIVHIYCIRDLSLNTRYEQRIAELEREIAHLSRHSVLGELTTSITHELSQPLTAIANYAAAAGRCRLQDATAEELANSIGLIARAGEQAKRAWLIMHKLRQLLQHRSGEHSRDDLRLAVEDAVQLATLGVAQQRITVSVELPPEPVIVLMDRIQVQVLLANLIRNAVDELSTTDGERKIWIRLAINAQNLAELAVEDTGHGIAPEVFENIFDPFHTTKAEGLGVGLALSRRIAQAHGGRLAAANRPDGGAIFSFVVPVV